MKRRIVTKALLFALIGGPALSADPLPTLRETPMLVEQVKSGALPPIEQRLPQPLHPLRRDRWERRLLGEEVVDAERAYGDLFDPVGVRAASAAWIKHMPPARTVQQVLRAHRHRAKIRPTRSRVNGF